MDEIKIDKIIRSKRKTIALVVSHDATLVVRVPMMTTLEYIENIVFKKRFWINEKKKQVLKNGSLSKAKEFVNGEGFSYLGETYKLKIENCEDIKIADYLYFPQKYISQSRIKMIEWYKQKALEIIIERVRWYSQITGWKFKSISITNAKKQWGSCGPSGSINFAWRLIMVPLDVIDYVVVHELAHIKEKNHASGFWNNVKTVLPDYKSRQRWLKDNGINLVI